jgi:tRNA-splicing ligase RtcB (3'-phosphate/5'-hydroxy nucleic acid ligase)
MPAMHHIDGYKLLNFASQIDDNHRAGERDRSHPFVHPHIALMPDAGRGNGSAVGIVIPTIDAVIPAARC